MTHLLASLALAAALAAPQSLDIPLRGPDGKEVGMATLTELKQGVQIRVKARGLSPGEHAFHFHEKGSCVGPDFMSAGGHFTVPGRKHGFDVAKGPHSGDMPNLVVKDNGELDAEVINMRVTLKSGKGSLLDKNGTALVIHEKADDYKSQPAGAAGDRVACGEIKPE